MLKPVPTGRLIAYRIMLIMNFKIEGVSFLCVDYALISSKNVLIKKQLSV